MNIGQAVEHLLEHDMRVCRKGWNGKGMWLSYVPGGDNRRAGYVEMRTASGDLVPWTCSQTDLLAEDWEIV